MRTFPKKYTLKKNTTERVQTKKHILKKDILPRSGDQTLDFC